MIAAPTGHALIAGARLRDLFKSCPWMEHAFKEMGQHCYAGPENSPRVLEYLSQVGSFADDETSWCSAFANWCMKRAGVQGSGKPNAKSWLTWGTGIAQSTPASGALRCSPDRRAVGAGTSHSLLATWRAIFAASVGIKRSAGTSPPSVSRHTQGRVSWACGGRLVTISTPNFATLWPIQLDSCSWCQDARI